MRIGAAFAVLALCACSNEPDFDERYDAAKERIEASASEIDEELQKRRDEVESRDRALAASPPAEAE